MFLTLIDIKLSSTSSSADTKLHRLFCLSRAHAYRLIPVKDAGMRDTEAKNMYLLAQLCWEQQCTSPSQREDQLRLTNPGTKGRAQTPTTSHSPSPCWNHQEGKSLETTVEQNCLAKQQPNFKKTTKSWFLSSLSRPGLPSPYISPTWEPLNIWFNIANNFVITAWKNTF